MKTKVGGWYWNGAHWEREGAEAYYIGEAGYEFHVSRGLAACVNKNGLQGFLKLIEVNPELKTPTEDKEAA